MFYIVKVYLTLYFLLVLCMLLCGWKNVLDKQSDDKKHQILYLFHHFVNAKQTVRHSHITLCNSTTGFTTH